MLNQSTPNHLLAAALDYAKRGWSVIPVWSVAQHKCLCPEGHKGLCASPGKHPIMRNWQADAMTDPLAIERFWGNWEEANVAVRTGRIVTAEGTSDRFLWVLDIDRDKDGDETLTDLERKHGKLPDTRCVITGSGVHYYFTSPIPVKTTAGKLGAGIDTRGGGGSHGHGYVLAPPSIHVTGRRYIHDAGTPEEPAEAPRWLVDLANAEAPTLEQESTPEDDERILDGALGGLGRKKSLIKLGRSMRANGASEDAIYAALAEHNTKCEPPLEDKEVRRMARECAKKKPGKSKQYQQFEKAQAAQAGDWTALLPLDSKGKIKPTLDAHYTILTHDPEYAGKLRLNTMSMQIVCDGVALSDQAMTALRVHMERKYAFSTGESAMQSAVALVASENAFHPVVEYLDALKWDGMPRITDFAKNILGIDPDPLTRKQLQCWFVSAVARARQPGCKVDNVLILVGPQGAGKSTVFAELAGAWFCDTHMDLGNKDAYLQLATTWIYEWGEVEKIVGRRSADEVKAFLTSRYDTYRPPYGRNTIRHERSCVIVGTTNEDGFLSDTTGSRRFWVVQLSTNPINLDALRGCRDQLWAEADALYKSGSKWYLDQHEEAEREKRSVQYLEHDSWEQAVHQYLFKTDASNPVLIPDILRECLSLPSYQINSGSSRRVASILRKLGYENYTDKTHFRRPVKAWKLKGVEPPAYENPEAPAPNTQPHDDFDF